MQLIICSPSMSTVFKLNFLATKAVMPSNHQAFRSASPAAGLHEEILQGGAQQAHGLSTLRGASDKHLQVCERIERKQPEYRTMILYSS